MPQQLSIESRISRDPDVLTSRVLEQLVMVDVERGAYYGLDDIGTVVWEALEEPVRVTELCDRLQERYEVDRGTCEQDTLEMLQWLLDWHLLVVHD